MKFVIDEDIEVMKKKVAEIEKYIVDSYTCGSGIKIYKGDGLDVDGVTGQILDIYYVPDNPIEKRYAFVCEKVDGSGYFTYFVPDDNRYVAVKMTEH